MAKAKRKLKVTGQKPITQIKLRNGGTTTLYEVFATTEHGEYVEEPLRAFTELDVGQVLEYDIEPYHHPTYGTSYTLTPPKKETARRLRELEEKMEAIVGWAEAQGFNLQRALAAKTGSGMTPTAEEAAQAEADKRAADERASERFGDDAPWKDEDLDEGPKADPPS